MSFPNVPSGHSRLALPTSATPPQNSHQRWPALWTGGAVLCLLALARWQRHEDITSLILAATGLAASLGALRTIRAPRTFALAALTALITALGVAVAETRARSELSRAGEMWALAARNADVERVATAISDVQVALIESAERAAGAAKLVAMPDVRRAESGIAVFELGRMTDRDGQSRVPLTPDADGVTVSTGTFHTALVARVTRGDRTAVASVLLTAAPPAARFARALVPDVVSSDVASLIRLDRPSSLYPVDANDMTRRAVSSGMTGEPLLVVSAAPRSLDEALLTGRQRAQVRTIIPMAVGALFVLVVAWRRPARLPQRLLTVISLLVMIAVAPLGQLSNVSPLFNAVNYFSPVGGALTGNIAALTLAALLALLALFRVLRSTRIVESRRLAMALVIGIAALGPFALRDLARGITFPASGASVWLWLTWQLAIALAAAGILIAGASAGQVVIGRSRGLPPSLGPILAAVAAIAAPALWTSPGAWPDWYLLLWIVSIASLAFVRRGRALVTAVAFVAGCGAVTLTWGATTRTRMQLAERNVQQLGVSDESASQLIARFAETLASERGVIDRARLVRIYAESELARAGYSSRLAMWTDGDPNVPAAAVDLIRIADDENAQAGLAQRVRATRRAEIVSARDGLLRMLVAAVPLGRDSVVTVAVPPRTWLLPPDPFARLTGIAATPDRAPPYSLSLSQLRAETSDTTPQTMQWRREGNVMLGDATAGPVDEQRLAHVEVDLRGPEALWPRGALLVFLDVAIILGIWLASAMADGGFWRWLRWQRGRWRRSYRSRLSVALLAFFLAPAGVFAVWEAYRLREDDRNARELLVREALRTADLAPIGDALRNAEAVPAESGSDQLGSAAPAQNSLFSLLTTPVLADLADDVGGPLFAYRDGVLAQASDDVLTELAPFGTLLPQGVPTGVMGDFVRLDMNGELMFTQSIQLATRTALVGFRPTLGPEGTPLVLATAARGDAFALDARRADLAVLVALVVVAGVLAALWLSGAAARTLARPIGTLRDAALAIASGRPMPPIDDMPPAEFVPVFGAFGRMATDLSTSRAALEEAQRRTAAVLREVASGVIAVRHDGTVLLANPRAERLLGGPLLPGTALPGPTASGANDFGAWPLVSARVRDFLERRDVAFDAFDVITPRSTVPASDVLTRAAQNIESPDAAMSERQLRASLTRLPGGAVLTLDDVTELATAQRVLAWGEMARQVAHEIKNPLTPIRLGVQHLRRAWRDGRIDFANILDTNVTRILNEIDHLDEIARAFSRYGGAPAERAPVEVTEITKVARDVIDLERMGESEVQWELLIKADSNKPDGSQSLMYALARAEELKDVLLNLLENARLANARAVRMTVSREEEHVVIEVSDDGEGIGAEVLPFIFQPHFSTRTSGSGLGLAISRRMLEGWGGSIAAKSVPGAGTTLTVTLKSA